MNYSIKTLGTEEELKSVDVIGKNVISLNDDFSSLRKIIKKIKNDVKKKRKISHDYIIISNNSKYLNDFVASIKAAYILDNSKRIDFIYDTICDFLDNDFKKNNYCDFQKDKCIACRLGVTEHERNGCCYSFEVAGFFSMSMIKNEGPCRYLTDQGCSTRNISCKLVTCRYLQENGVMYSPYKFLLIRCFLSIKQIDVITYNFFTTKEEILNKLKKKSYSPYVFWLMLRLFKVKR
jgi:hypothetical protein